MSFSMLSTIGVMKMTKKVAAFFDIDGTIYREGLITELFKKFLKFEIIEEDVWHKEVEPAYNKWVRREGDYDTYLLKMVEIFMEAIKGISKEHVEYVARRVVNQKGDRVYTFSRDRIQWHREQGHIIIAISGSPIELVHNMAEKYNLDDFRGTIYQTDQHGHYTGELIPMWDSVSKKNAIAELTELYDIDLDQSYAYGDTTGDLTMFKSVGNPYAINPTNELLNQILESEDLLAKIKVIVERKDVKYLVDLATTKLV